MLYFHKAVQGLKVQYQMDSFFWSGLRSPGVYHFADSGPRVAEIVGDCPDWLSEQLPPASRVALCADGQLGDHHANSAEVQLGS